MESNLPIKKLFKMAIYTSTAIGVLVVEPLFISLTTFVPDILKLLPLNQFPLFLLSIFAGTFITFIIWSYNILLSHLINKHSERNISGTVKYISSYLGCFAFFISLRVIVLIIIKHPIQNELIARANYFSFDIIRIFILGSINTIILIIQDLVLLRERKAIVELENAQLKIKNIEAVNQQLKQQIHPHFLFNALNTLKTLIKKQPANAEDYLVRLSDFLRFTISLDNVNTVKLGDELKLCINYLEMQKVRFGEALQFNINIDEDVKNTGFIPVFSLQLLLENAIKHNALTQEAPLIINIENKEGKVIVSNNIKAKSSTEVSTGLGLTNLSERYKILSGDEILIDESNNNFSVSIKILKR